MSGENGDDSISFGTHSGVRQGCAFSITLFSYREVQELLEEVNHHAAAVSMRVNAPKVLSVRISDEQCKAVCLMVSR